MKTNHKHKFKLGQILITRGAIVALNNAKQSPAEFLHRHQRCDCTGSA